jgi:hypothetical protein
MSVDVVDDARARAEELIARITAEFDRPGTPRTLTVTLADVTDAIEHDLAAKDTRHLYLSIAARRRERAVAPSLGTLGQTEADPATLQRQTNTSVNRWRRHHGPAIVAQVAPLDLGRWNASAWRANEPSAAVQSPRKIAALMSAQAAADHLARMTFDHRCDLEGCGDWMCWPE